MTELPTNLKDWVLVIIAILGLILSMYQVIKKYKINVYVEVERSVVLHDAITMEDGKPCKIRDRYWNITVRNNGEKPVTIKSFWINLEYNGVEHSYRGPFSGLFEHKGGFIEFPKKLDPHTELPTIVLDDCYFNSEFKNEETGEFNYPQNGFRPIAYFKDQSGKKHSNKYL